MKIVRFNKLIIFFSLILAVVSLSGCSLIKENDKNNILNAYASENSLFPYYTFKATVKSVREVSSADGNNKFFKFDVDYDYFEEQFSGDEYTYADGGKRWENSYLGFNTYTFWVDPANYLVLSKNGGYDLLSEGTEVLISANNYYGYSGWRYPILSLTVGETIYLEFETGKENYINYVRSGFKVM